MKNELYTTPRETLLAQNDTNFCVPLALSIVSGVDIEKVNNLLMTTPSNVVHGPMRRKRKGVYENDWSDANMLAKLGITFKKFNVSAKTVSRIERELPAHQRFVIKVRRHALSFREGMIQDWTQGRKHRIIDVYQVCDLNGNPITDGVAPAKPARPVRPAKPAAPKQSLVDAIMTIAPIYWDVKTSGRWVSVKIAGRPSFKITQSKGRIVLAINNNEGEITRHADKVFIELSQRASDTTYVVESLETAIDFIRAYD